MEYWSDGVLANSDFRLGNSDRERWRVKSQITNLKYQTNHNDQNTKSQTIRGRTFLRFPRFVYSTGFRSEGVAEY